MRLTFRWSETAGEGNPSKAESVALFARASAGDIGAVAGIPHPGTMQPRCIRRALDAYQMQGEQVIARRRTAERKDGGSAFIGDGGSAG